MFSGLLKKQLWTCFNILLILLLITVSVGAASQVANSDAEEIQAKIQRAADIVNQGQNLAKSLASSGKTIQQADTPSEGWEVDLKVTDVSPGFQIKRKFEESNPGSHSFGEGWVFNFDTRIILGIAPNIFEHYETMSQLHTEMENIHRFLIKLDKQQLAAGLVEEIEQATEYIIEFEQSHHRIEDEYHYAQFAHYYNLGNLDWGAQSDWEEIGSNRLLWIDEEGELHYYTISQRPKYHSDYKNYDGWNNYYPQGATAIPYDSSDHVIRILPDGTYQLQLEDGQTYKYSHYGKLVEIADAEGKQVKFTYNNHRELVQIRDNLNRKVNLTRAEGKVVKIEDASGETLSYTYDQESLATFSAPQGETHYQSKSSTSINSGQDNSLLTIESGNSTDSDDHEHNWIGLSAWVEPLEYTASGHKIYDGDKCTICNKRKTWFVEYRSHSKREGDWAKDNDSTHSRTISCTECYWDETDTEGHTIEFNTSSKADECTICELEQPNDSYEASGESKAYVSQGETSYQDAQQYYVAADGTLYESDAGFNSAQGKHEVAGVEYHEGIGYIDTASGQIILSEEDINGANGKTSDAGTSNGSATGYYDDSVDAEGISRGHVDDLNGVYVDGTYVTSDADLLQTSNETEELSNVDGTNDETQGDNSGITGDPVKYSTGEYVSKSTDLRINGPEAFNLQVVRFYGNFKEGSYAFGKGWNFNYDTRMVIGVRPDFIEVAETLADYANELADLHEQAKDDYQNAVDSVEEAISLAEDSVDHAEQAVAEAKAAKALAESAIEYAEDAEDATEEAEDALQAALSSLETAVTESDAAKTLAEDAEKQADDAISSAASAISAADSGISKAQEALNAADGNSTLVSEAQAALSAAQTLKSDAEKVEVDAEDAKDRANTLATDLGTLLDDLAKLKADVETAQSTATEKQTQAATSLANADEALRLAKAMISTTNTTLGEARAQLKDAKDWHLKVLDSYVLVEEVGAMKREVQALSAQAQIDREYSEVARYRNQYNLDLQGDPELDQVGIQQLVLVDENGIPHLYRFTSEPDFATTATYPDGKKNYYPNGDYPVADEPTDDQLEVLADGSYILTKKDQSVYYYSYYGKLLKVTGPKGGFLEFTYNADQELTQIADQYGRAVEFQHTNGMITKVIDPISREHNYGYSGNRLVQYTDPTGATRQYLYNEDGLAETIYPDGSGWKYYYMTLNGRSVMDYQIDRSGAVFDFEYDLDNRQTLITDRRGNQTVYHFNDRYLTEKTVKDDYNEILKTYDAEDNLISVTNEKGLTTQYTYDQDNNLASIIDPKGQTVTFTYNELNKVTSITDKSGQTTYYEYDGVGNLLAIRYADGTAQSYTRNQWGWVTSAQDQAGRITSYNYDAYGYPTEKINPDGTKEQYEYNQVGELLKVTKPNGAEISYDYNLNGQVTSITDELGYVTSYQYTLRGEIGLVTDPNGNVYEYKYDQRNKLVEIIDPEGQSQKFDYDGEENLTKKILAENIHYLYEYDNLDRLVASTQVETGVTVNYEYDPVGNLIGFIDGEDRKTSYVYDELNRKVQAIDPLSQSMYYEYLPNNQLKAITDKRGYTTNFEYDLMGRLTKVTNALGESIQYEYDQLGNLLKFTDAKGLETQFVYDIRNRLTKKINPADGETLYEYDLVGNLTRAVDPGGNASTYEYDLKGRLIKETNALGHVKSYEYDPVGNIIAMTDASGVRTTYGYDKLNRLVEISNALDYVTKFGYNPLGKIAWKEDAKGNRVEYQYDGLGQITSVTDGEGYQVEYIYDKSGNLISQVDQLGNVTTYKYDDLSRIIEVVDALNNSTQYSYDGNSNMTAITNGENNAYQYEYDALNRPVAEINYLGNRQSYQYDPNNNLVKKVDFNGNATSYQYDDLNRLLEVAFADDSTKSFTYDQLGNLTQAVNQNSEELFYYDELSRLTKVEVDKFNEPAEVDWTIDYTYNAAGQRTNVNVSGPEVTDRETRYQYDELNRLTLVEMPEDEKVEFKYDELNRVIEQINANRTGTTYTYTSRSQVETIVHWKDDFGQKEVLDSYGYVYDGKGQRIFEVQGDAEVQAYEYDATGRIQKVYYPFEDAKKMEDLKERAYYGLVPAVEDPFEYELEFEPNLSWEEHLNFTSQLDETIGDLDITEEFGVVGSLTLGRGTEALPLPDSLGLKNKEYQALDQLFDQVKMANYGTFDPQGQSYWTEQFNYDANGNITSKQNGWGEIAYQYNQNNQLVQAGNRSYAYDLNGNLTSEGMGSFSNDYEYNLENRLIKATNDKYANFYNGDQPFFGEISFAYDALGRKIEKVADPLKKPQVETTKYLYDGLGVNALTEYQMLSWDLPVKSNSLSPDLVTLGNGKGKGSGPVDGGGGSGGGSGKGSDDSNGLPFRGGKLSKYNEYYYGNRNLLGMWHSIDPSQGNGYGVHDNPKQDYRYYHKDALGSIVMMTGKHAEPVQKYEYDAFGHPYQGHFLHNPNNNNPFGYTGQRYEPELGAYSFAYRHYNPHSMRWMTADPVKDGANWYQYVGSNPVNYWDPLGLEMEEGQTYFMPWDGKVSPEQQLKNALTFDEPYPASGYDYSGWNELWNKFTGNTINGKIQESAGLSSKQGIIVDGIKDVYTGLNPTDTVPEGRRQKINQAVGEWNARMQNPSIDLLGLSIEAKEYSSSDAAWNNIPATLIETSVGAGLSYVDGAYAGGVPVTNTLFKPRFPRVKEGDISLKISTVYSYKPDALPQDVYNYSKRPLSDRIWNRHPKEVEEWYYKMTIDVQIRDGKVMEANWTYDSYMKGYEFGNSLMLDMPVRSFNVSSY